jgi:hypothetical protein
MGTQLTIITMAHTMEPPPVIVGANTTTIPHATMTAPTY